MSKFLLGLFLIGAGFGGASLVTAATDQLAANVANNFGRIACRYNADSIQVTAAPTLSTASTGLQAATRYRVFCPQATYYDQEAAVGGTGTAATSADDQIAANTAIEIWTKQGDFMTFRAVATTGTCNISECQ